MKSRELDGCRESRVVGNPGSSFSLGHLVQYRAMRRQLAAASDDACERSSSESSLYDASRWEQVF
jgi:hypothetical protein